MTELTCEQLMDKVIRKAKKYAEKKTDNELANRRWIEAAPEPSYGSKEYVVKLFVLEGSPPRAFILSEFSSGIIRVFGGALEPLRVFRAYDYFYDDLGEHKSMTTGAGWTDSVLKGY